MMQIIKWHLLELFISVVKYYRKKILYKNKNIEKIIMYVDIKQSSRKYKKLMAIFYDDSKKKIKTVHFGDNRYEDFTQHHDEKRRAQYVSRHSSNEDWNDFMSAGALSYYILWYDKNKDVAIHEYAKRFNLKLL